MTIGFSVRRDVINKANPQQLNTLHQGWEWIPSGTPNRLLKALSKGYAVTPAKWKDGYKSKYRGEFLESHYVMLDFDNGMSLQDALNNKFIASTACFLYTSPSHMKPGKGERFRIVWTLSEPLTSWKDHDDVILSLREKVGYTDDPAINAASCLFGSKPLDDNYLGHIWNGYQNVLSPAPLIEEQNAKRMQKRLERELAGYEDGDLWEHDKDTCGEDRVALMVHCLKVQEDTGFRYVPERLPDAGTFTTCWKVMAGLVHYFGVELTYSIIEQADWYGCNEKGDWDIDRIIDDLSMREVMWEPGMEWSSYTTILKVASQELGNPDRSRDGFYSPAMPKSDFHKFKFDTTMTELDLTNLTDTSDEDKDLHLEALREEVELLSRTNNELNLDLIFPKQLAAHIKNISKTMPCHPDGIAMLLLPCITSILGAKHQIFVFNGYYEKMILQICLLLGAGSRKSAQLKLVADPLWKMDCDARKSGSKRERVQIDSTPEGLVTKASMAENANGFLRRQDELSSLFKSLTQYNNGNALEQELRLWDGQPIKQSRVNKDSDRIVDKPCISTTATSQPKTMTKLIELFGGLQDSANGLWGRWLFVRPPYVKGRAYRGADGTLIAEEFKDYIDRLYKSLDAMRGECWRPTPAAKNRFYDTNDMRQSQAEKSKNSFMENTYMKAIGHTARIAGVLAAIRVVHSQDVWSPLDEYEASITEEDVLGAEHIMNYFVKQAQALAVENTEKTTSGNRHTYGGVIKSLVEWSNKKESGSTITARDVLRSGLKSFESMKADEVRIIFKQAADAVPDRFSLEVDKGKYCLKLLT